MRQERFHKRSIHQSQLAERIHDRNHHRAAYIGAGARKFNPSGVPPLPQRDPPGRSFRLQASTDRRMATVTSSTGAMPSTDRSNPLPR